ncbi:PREDICTED: general odorant-binding protein 56d-like isoform X1 [Drosophila arizonae]|uniref:General odorant-binding protein 56d-like isoform X1 n=1 Tax=Drosophila arizonae TaxID=7263 RepID=A0ABM1PMI9_DROAR|nr:PREDICTED: general odorant-binding protein 56d-like isoform X1 [Drosophila arizonae]
MKYLIVLVACVALVAADELQLSDEQKARAKANAGACIEQEGVTKEQAMALREGKFENVDEKVKCFANCFLEKSGFLADGQIKSDVVLEKLGPIVGVDKVKAAQEKCDSLKGSDKCDTGFQLYQCYYKQHTQI